MDQKLVWRSASIWPAIIDRSRHFGMAWVWFAILVLGPSRAADDLLPGSHAFDVHGDVSKTMVEGIHRMLDRELERAASLRSQYWKPDFRSAEAYVASLTEHRRQFAQLLGVVEDPIVPSRFEASEPTLVARSNEQTKYQVKNVRWRVLDNIYGEGLLMEPTEPPIANVIAIPDATQLPESMLGNVEGIEDGTAWGKLLAEHGCRVLVPILANRESTYSGDPATQRWTGLSHREWLWRMAFEVGRTPIGYEVQKVLAGIDLLEGMANPGSNASQAHPLPMAIAGYGEGGRLALYAAALDERLQHVWVRAYFDSRQDLWKEPADRMVWSLLERFGDAELAMLVAPRKLILEAADGPALKIPPPSREPGRRSLAAPGELVPSRPSSMLAEVNRAKKLLGPYHTSVTWIPPNATNRTSTLADGFAAFMDSLGRPRAQFHLPEENAFQIHPAAVEDRQRRTVEEMTDHLQEIVRGCERTRQAKFWNNLSATDPTQWLQAQAAYRRDFDQQIIGRWDLPRLPLNPRSRLALDEHGGSLNLPDARYTAWDIKLDVFPDLFAWGILLLPNDIQAGERRPVIVCQHGLEGLPESCLNLDPSSRAYAAYKAFARQLADRGFVVFVPHNPYRGGDAFRSLQRKSWALGRHLFSTIHAQHAAILDWLEQQAFVDASKIAFYGLSYGGKSAMRIPAVHPRYCLSICSGDFNEWVRKNAAVDYPNGYLYTAEYEIFEWDLGHSYNYAEMAALIAPRPFMVEHGFQDRVATAEWASYEYAKVRRFYHQLGIADRTEYEFFGGPHTIHGQGTFEFLHRHLRWQRPE